MTRVTQTRYWLPAQTPTLPNRAHPRDFNESKLIAQKKCYDVFQLCKRHYLVENGKIPSSILVSISI